MTTNSITSRVEYIENGVTVTFTVPFKFLSQDDLLVQRFVGGVLETLVRGTHYSVSGAGVATGGSITKTAPGTAGTVLRITRRTAREQGFDYEPTDTFPAESHEAALDRQSLVNQDQDVALAGLEARTVRVPDGEIQPELRRAALRAGFVPWWNESGELDYRLPTSFAKGDPGGNLMAIGLFQQGATFTIPTGTDMVQTSGYSAAGRGGARYFYDAAVDSAYVTVNPRTSFLSFNGRGFRLAQQPVTPETAGATGDGTGNDSPAFTALCAVGFKYIKATPGAVYLFTTTTTLADGVTYDNTGATVRHALIAANAALFNLEGRADVTLIGGTFDGNKAGRATLGLTGDAYAVRTANSRNIRLRDAICTSFATNGRMWGDFSALADEYTSGCFIGCICRDEAHIFATALRNFLIADNHWQGIHYAAVAINSSELAGRLITGVIMRNNRIDGCRRIAIEIKFPVGLVIENLDIDEFTAASTNMGVSVPGAQSCRFRGGRFGPMSYVSGYGFEMVGWCDDNLIEGFEFDAGFLGAPIQFTMDSFGFARNNIVRGCTFRTPAAGVRFFRGRRTFNHTYTDLTGVFLQDERFYLQSSGSYAAAAADKRGFVAAVADGVAYLGGLARDVGRSVVNLALVSGNVLVGETSGATLTLTAGTGSASENASLPVLAMWSRARGNIVEGCTAYDSEIVTDLNSGSVGTIVRSNKQVLATVHKRFCEMRGDHWHIHNNEILKLPTCPSGGICIEPDTGTNIEHRICGNIINGNGLIDYAFVGGGEDWTFTDNLVINPGVQRPYDFSRSECTLALWSNNRVLGVGNGGTPSTSYNSITFARRGDMRTSELRAVGEPNDPRDGYFLRGSTFHYNNVAAGAVSPGYVVITSGYPCANPWTTATLYEFSDTFALASYVHNAGRVYRCMEAGAGTTSDAPVHTAGDVTGADDYTWRHVGVLMVVKEMPALAA